ncbi:MAG: AMP-binding protein [Eubacterium sp.]|nr:AMP-binding protein [Eubacterium sp.]
MENQANAKHVRIPVPQLPIIHDLPVYDDLRELLDGSAEKYGEKDVFVIKTKRETKSSPAEYRHVSFIELRKEIDWLGAAFMDTGLKGKRLAIIGKNRYEWALGYYAQTFGLGIVIPLDKGLPAEELETSITKAKADVMLFDKDQLGLVRSLQAKPEFSNLEYICMDQIDGFTGLPELLEKGKSLTEKRIREYKELPIDKDALAFIIFTSGTSGNAKAVMLSHYNITFDIWATVAPEDLRSTDVNMAFLPYHHTFGSTGLSMMIYSGMTTVFCDGLRYIQKNLAEYKVSFFVGVPLIIESMYRKILAEIDKQGKTKTFRRGVRISRFLMKFGIDIRRKLFKEILDQLGGGIRYVISGASPLDADVARGFVDLGVKIIQGYGMTESSPVLAVESPVYPCPGTIGHSVPGVTLMIEDPNEEGIGELVARGPNVMLGYYENEEATAEIMEDGWLHTGDLASLDPKGNIIIRGRKKNVIVLRSGENVYPEELETPISYLPYVEECMVYGEPRRPGETRDPVVSVKIVYDASKIKAERGAETPDEIETAVKADIDKINEAVPAYKRILRLRLTEEPMEKTTTGKVKRYKQKI